MDTKMGCDERTNGHFKTLTSIANRFLRDGWTPDQVIAILDPTSRGSGFRPEHLRQLVQGISSQTSNRDSVSSFSPIYSGNSETGSRALTAIPADEFLAQGDTEISWIVKGLLPAAGVGILAGPEGLGKSWMLLDLALECARGGRWLGHYPTSGGKVLYIDEESSPVLLRRRLSKLMAAKQSQSCPEGLLLLVGQCVNLSVPQSVASLQQLVHDHKPALVIIDALIRVHAAEENSATEMSRVFAVLKKIVREAGCSFFIADHQRKPGQYPTRVNARLRGSSEKAAFVDTLLSLRGQDGHIVVEHSKSRFAEPEPAFMVTISDPEPDCTSVEYAGQLDAKGQTSRMEEVRDFIDVSLDKKHWVSRKELIAQATVEGISNKLLDEGLNSLLHDLQIERERRKPEGRGGKSDYYRKIASVE